VATIFFVTAFLIFQIITPYLWLKIDESRYVNQNNVLAGSSVATPLLGLGGEVYPVQVE
jgi:uncharacterized membrane protein YjfL (UPF0719 family)